MKVLILIVLLLQCLLNQPKSLANDTLEIIESVKPESAFTIYLIRHAEKQINKKDPLLTSCGIARAKELSRFFTNIELSIIYSTDYNRTKSTTAPIAKVKNLEVKLYDAKNLTKLYAQVINSQQNTLIVGHSNTTNTLAGLFSSTQIDKIPEDVFNLIYQITVINGNTHLQIFEQPTTCLLSK